jgi:RES domain-containing protein
MTSAWRLVREARSLDAFSGKGARLYGGRWNPQGLPATYLSATRSLAALEVLVHQTEQLPSGRFLFFEVRFPEEFVQTISKHGLAADWRSYPPSNSTLEASRRWLKDLASPVLRVPSILIPEESNYLLNPEHPRADEIEIAGPKPFTYDPRFLNPPARSTRKGLAK